jgi:energy-coupling factor transporter ATP-binding protein EcfA2
MDADIIGGVDEPPAAGPEGTEDVFQIIHSHEPEKTIYMVEHNFDSSPEHCERFGHEQRSIVAPDPPIGTLQSGNHRTRGHIRKPPLG